MEVSSSAHKPKMRSSGSGDKNKSPSSKKPPMPDSTTVTHSMSKLDLGGRGITFEVRVLLWEQLEQKLNVVEWDEARAILGENEIEENKALKEENLALLSIWKDYSLTTNSIEEQCQDLGTTKSPLPEPPHVRDLLFKQIKFFIDELSLRSKREIMSSTTPREQVVYEYVTRGGALPSRPSTASGARDKPTDIRPNSSRSSGTPTPPLSPSSPHDVHFNDNSETDTARQLLSAQEHIDLDVLQANLAQLKALLVQEHELLLRDAEFLQFCLEQQADYNSQLQKFTKEKQDSIVPTIQEMKEFNSKLEQKYLETSQSGSADKEKERRASSTRPRTTSLPDTSPKPMRQSLPSSATPPPPRSRNSLSSSTSSTPPLHKEEIGKEPITHTPHPPKEQRPDAQRPRTKLSNVTLSPTTLPSMSPSSPTASSSPLPTLTAPTMNASPKRTRLKQTQPV